MLQKKPEGHPEPEGFFCAQKEKPKRGTTRGLST
jgi:hypothetical protein